MKICFNISKVGFHDLKDFLTFRTWEIDNSFEDFDLLREFSGAFFNYVSRGDSTLVKAGPSESSAPS